MDKKGQSIVEYMLITILVILGIVFMGPYVLRSINAHYKIWDEGIQDSFEEHLKQAPPGDLPFINAECHCTLTKSPACGGTLCSLSQREMDWTNCTVQDCMGSAGTPSCIDDPTCCVATASDCGSFPLPILPNGTVNTSPPTNPPPAINNCYYGQREYLQTCGINNSVACQTDHTCPMPKCGGLILFPGSTIYCATLDTVPPTTTLSQDYDTTYVASGACPTGKNNCVAYCTPQYVPSALGCIRQFQVAPVLKSCSAPNAPLPVNCSCSQSSTSSCQRNCCTSGGPVTSVVTTDDLSFTFCTNTTPPTSILTVTVKPIGQSYTYPGIPSQVNGGCGGPTEPTAAQGEPSQSCAMDITIGP